VDKGSVCIHLKHDRLSPHVNDTSFVVAHVFFRQPKDGKTTHISFIVIDRQNKLKSRSNVLEYELLEIFFSFPLPLPRAPWEREKNANVHKGDILMYVHFLPPTFYLEKKKVKKCRRLWREKKRNKIQESLWKKAKACLFLNTATRWFFSIHVHSKSIFKKTRLVRFLWIIQRSFRKNSTGKSFGGATIKKKCCERFRNCWMFGFFSKILGWKFEILESFRIFRGNSGKFWSCICKPGECMKWDEIFENFDISLTLI
jgi:hypothetical protein